MVLDIDNFKEITATLARNKTRTLLTAFGIFWGTFMLTLLWGSGQGLQKLLLSNFEGFASNSAIVFSQRTSIPYKGFKKGMYWNLDLKDVENIRRMVPELSIVSPISSTNSTVKHKDKSYSVTIQALEPNIMDVLNPIIVKGRFINDTDIARAKKVCVIGVNVADRLFGSVDPIGQFVEADNVFYRVVGVVRQRSEMSFMGRMEDSVLLPLTTGQRTYNVGDKVHIVTMVAHDGYSPSQLRDKIFRAVRVNHPLHPDDKNSLYFINISEAFEQVGAVFTGVDVLILFVGFSSLIAGIIGVGNIMWIVVKERTKEFGIRRALGAKPRTVMTQILAESAVLTFVAGTAGICFSVGVLSLINPLISQMTGMPADFQLTFASAVVTLILFLSLGGLAGAIPAIKAMKIKPIEALNDK